MKRTRAAIIFLIVAAVSFSLSAYAQEETVGESLEWLVIARPAIAIEEVVNTIPTGDTDLTIQTKLKKILKGQPPQETSFSRHWLATAIIGQEDVARPANGTEYLLFFDDKGQVTNAINLKNPSHKLGVGADARDVAIAVNYTIYGKGEAIMDIVNHRLEKLAGQDNGQHATPPKSKQPEVPLDSAAWSILYNGNTCYLLVPDEPEETVSRSYEFSAPARPDVCRVVSQKPFEVGSPTTAQHNTLTIGCVPNGNEYPKVSNNLVLQFKIVDIAKSGDYELRWTENPDLLPDHKSKFPDVATCMGILNAIASVVPRETEIVPPAGSKDKPIFARWNGGCVYDERWKSAMVFQLDVGSEPPKNVAADPPK